MVRAVRRGLVDDLRHNEWISSIRHHGLHGGHKPFDDLLVLGERLVVAESKRSSSEVGFDRARLYDFNLHTDRLHLVGQRLADALNRKLGAMVERAQREGDLTADR